MSSSETATASDILLTPRLELRPVTVEIVKAILDGHRRQEIEALIGAEMPWTWPSRQLIEQVFPASLEAIVKDPVTRLWGDHFMVTREGEPRVVGSIIFHGKPDAEGACEVAYGVEEMSQRKGYAAEALAKCIEWAFNQPECNCIRAATTQWHKGSTRLLEKVGMKIVGERQDPDAGKMMVYEITR